MIISDGQRDFTNWLYYEFRSEWQNKETPSFNTSQNSVIISYISSKKTKVKNQYDIWFWIERAIDKQVK